MIVKTLILAALLLGQSDLPSYGSIEDIKGARRFYVASENEDSRKRILKALSKDKSLEVANSPDGAEFFVEFGELSREATTTGNVKERQQRSQMRVYVLREGRKHIVWSDTASRDTEHFFGMKMYDSGRGEDLLASKFLKELKKARGEKK